MIAQTIHKTNYSRLLAILFFTLLGTSSHAAPAVAPVSGLLNHGASVQITGNGFGIKTQAAPLVWDDFENGQSGDLLSSTGLYSLDLGRTSRYERSDRWAGNLAGMSPLAQTSNVALRSFPQSRTLYSSVQYKWDYAKLSTTLGRNYKGPRFQNGMGGNYHAGNPFIGWVADCGKGWFQYYTSPALEMTRTTGSTSTPPEWGSTLPAPFWKDWKRIEMVAKISTVNTADGWYGFWTNEKQWAWNQSAVTYRSDSDYDYFNRINLGFYSARDTLGNCTHTSDAVDTYYDNLYIDNTLSRVEVCDSAAWPNGSAEAHCEIQIPSGWQETSITFTVNRGRFAAGDNAFLYVVDAAGVANQTGVPVQFTEGDDATAPSAPQSLRTQ